MKTAVKSEAVIREEVVVPVMLHGMCPEPGCHGEMEYTFSAYPTYPPSFQHACKVCGHKEASSGNHFPRVEFRPRGEQP